MSGIEPVYRELWQDVRYAARVFPKQPVFAAAAVLTLALGIGATSAIFGVVYGVLLKPLPFFEPERLVSLAQIAPHGAGANDGAGTRPSRGCAIHVPPARALVDDDRHCGRNRHRACAHPGDVDVPVRRGPDGSDHLCRGCPPS